FRPDPSDGDRTRLASSGDAANSPGDARPLGGFCARRCGARRGIRKGVLTTPRHACGPLPRCPATMSLCMRLFSAMAGLVALVLAAEARAEPITFSTDTFEIIGGMNTEEPRMRRSTYKGKEV